MRQRLHVGRVDGHHRVEEKGEVDALGLGGELEGGAVAIEGPRSGHGRDPDRGCIGVREEPLAKCAVGQPVH